MNIISNCQLCEEHSLHVMEVANDYETIKTMQCVNCGYASADKFTGTKKTNESYKSLNDDMKRWAKETDGRLWIPAIITLPTGMLYPIDIDNLVTHQLEMKWAFAKMKEIPEEDRHNYPVDGQPEKFYEKRYDTDNPVIYEIFFDAISYINDSAKQPKVTPIDSIKLPTLKKVEK